MKKKETEQPTPQSPFKTDWNFVITLLCIGLLGITVCMLGRYINVQAERIDQLQLEMLPTKHHCFDDSIKPVGVSWEGKGQVLASAALEPTCPELEEVREKCRKLIDKMQKKYGDELSLHQIEPLRGFYRKRLVGIKAGLEAKGTDVFNQVLAVDEELTASMVTGRAFVDYILSNN